jgi:hypothetical protein
MASTLVELPKPPPPEATSIEKRLKATLAARDALAAKATTPLHQLHGEDYEIAVALALFEQKVLTAPQYVSRLSLPGDPSALGEQKIFVSGRPGREEYDLVHLDGRGGWLIGDASIEKGRWGKKIRSSLEYAIDSVWYNPAKPGSQVSGVHIVVPGDSRSAADAEVGLGAIHRSLIAGITTELGARASERRGLPSELARAREMVADVTNDLRAARSSEYRQAQQASRDPDRRDLAAATQKYVALLANQMQMAILVDPVPRLHESHLRARIAGL